MSAAGERVGACCGRRKRGRGSSAARGCPSGRMCSANARTDFTSGTATSITRRRKRSGKSFRLSCLAHPQRARTNPKMNPRAQSGVTVPHSLDRDTWAELLTKEKRRQAAALQESWPPVTGKKSEAGGDIYRDTID